MKNTAGTPYNTVKDIDFCNKTLNFSLSCFLCAFETFGMSMIIKECAIKAGKKPMVIATPVSIPKCSVATTAPNPAERRAVWIKKVAWHLLWHERSLIP